MNLYADWKGFYYPQDKNKGRMSSDVLCAQLKDHNSYNLIDTHYGGFFACTFSALCNMVRAYNACKVLPESIDLNHSLSMSCDSNGDLYNLFFELQNSIDLHSILKVNAIPIAFASRPFTQQNYGLISPLWNKYFTPNSRIKSLCDDLIKKYDLDLNRTLGVYYRGSDKIREEKLPTFEEYIDKVQIRVNEGSFDRVFLQTDELKFKDAFLTSVKNSFHIDELGFSETGDGVHRELRRKGRGRTKNSEYMLAVVHIFSQLNSLVVNTSHVSYAMCLYRNSVKNVLQYRRGAWIG